MWHWLEDNNLLLTRAAKAAVPVTFPKLICEDLNISISRNRFSKSKHPLSERRALLLTGLETRGNWSFSECLFPQENMVGSGRSWVWWAQTGWAGDHHRTAKVGPSVLLHTRGHGPAPGQAPSSPTALCRVPRNCSMAKGKWLPFTLC